MGEKPDLLGVAYTSVASVPFDEAQLSSLLTWCREWNASVDVTGVLLHREGRFIQFLEGPERAVRDLVAKISRDPRHTRVRVLLDDPVAERQFAEWTMGFQALDDIESMPEGFRTSFDDLENGDDRILMQQAARDLTRWFRAGAAKSA
ncbi:BLUF domain-containing protein [Pseudolysinimonas sp.]|jgi:hypothetical protein|uniref:BLUF domain-containing protein n=1 Tax=Pseudolysinimonas sp. TaxID=2680009 RepID=UPI003783E20D